MTGSADVFHSYRAFCVHRSFTVHICCFSIEDLTDGVRAGIICEVSDSRRRIRARGHLVSLSLR